MIKNKRTEGKIKTHYGMKDFYKHFKENNKDIEITNKKYYDIIYDFNLELINLIIDYNIEYQFPFIGSTLSIKKSKHTPKIVEGKLYNTSPVDWKSTNELWDLDNEAKEKKLLVRYSNFHTSKYVFRIYFKKYVHSFKNKKWFKFKPNRLFQRTLSKRIKDETKERYDAFLLY